MMSRPLGGRDIAIVGFFAALLTGFLAATQPLLALAGFCAIVFLTWVVARPELVLMAMVAALPWEAMLHYPTETLSTVKLLGVALVAGYAFRVVTGESRLRTSPVLGFGVLFSLVVGLSLLASPELAAGLQKAFRYAFFVLFLFLVAQMVPDRPTGRRLLRIYAGSAAVAGFVGLASFLSGSVTRAAGPVEDPNDFAYLMATAVPLAAFFFKEDRRFRPLWGIAVAVLLATAAAALSRGALVGLGVLLLWALFTRRLSLEAVVPAIAAVFMAVVLALAIWAPLIEHRLEEKNSIAEKNVESREAFWSAATQMWMSSPLLGVGPDRFGKEAPEYVRNNPIALREPLVHNAYLELLAESGPLALGFFVAMLGASWAAFGRAERRAREANDREGANLAAALKGSLLVAIVSALFLSEQVAAPIWLICALAASGTFAAGVAKPSSAAAAVAPA
jgi:putative inorganic carbon (HCO3(-)) transporter